ncbi:MAG: hypothetical protein JXB10_09195 [Pirellulales bacterium]|nr:hypothetical protein [Pirellulales bacterium]
MACTPNRREFIQFSSTATALLATGGLPAIAGPFTPQDMADHYVPTDKKLKPQWVESLYAKGKREWYAGQDLKTIGMPIGGITTSQIYLTGDGRLAHWDIFNMTTMAPQAYELGRHPDFPIKQGFAIQMRSSGQVVEERTLDVKGFSKVRFCGEYPIGCVEYPDASLPVSIALTAFSPFIPLNAADSALPVTVMEYTVKNTSSAPVDVSMAGWLENAVGIKSGEIFDGKRINRSVKHDGLTMVLETAEAVKETSKPREPIVLADFEGKNYGDWKAEGEAFGKGPARGTLPNQSPVSGFQGQGLVNTFLGGDDPHGKLTSPKFKIQRKFINFLIGGGHNPRRTCINLLVGGKVVRTATGGNDEKMQWASWNVRKFEGREAQIEIVDRQSGGWGHINIDQIEMADTSRIGVTGPLHKQPDFGSMALGLLDGEKTAFSSTALPDAEKPLAGLFENAPEVAERLFEQPLLGAAGKSVTIAPGKEAKFTFVVAWHFPNRPEHGNFYTNRFQDAGAVVEYVAENFPRLQGQTELWHKTWYDSTLPYWVLDRLFMPVSYLATGTCQWWANGRFWAWEGVACCAGTCGHVWNYEHAMARLFPELERSVREMQDFAPGIGFNEQTGSIGFRGEGWTLWAGDSQPGYVLKAYREHLMSPDNQFLKQLWPRIRKAMEFLIREDADDDGLLEGRQHNTYDIDFFGPNPMVASLYHAALRAAEEMARAVGDVPFAEKCRKIYETGREKTVKELFNGEYFIQKVDLKEHPRFQYANGCLADQIFGEGWAAQVGLGRLYPKETVLSTLKSIWKYNWTPDVGAQNTAHPPQRWFANPGEAGLFTCTWPKGKHLGPESVLYRDEVWTGIEYQVAGNMIWEGMLEEGLALCRAVHERYHPAKHNPWNEIECGDHYSRAMASYGVFLALCGYEYNGPQQHLGFAPRITPENFKSAFTTAESWGTFAQKIVNGVQTEKILVRWGKLPLKSLSFELPEGQILHQATVSAAGQSLAVTVNQDGRRVNLAFMQPVTLKENEELTVKLQ